MKRVVNTLLQLFDFLPKKTIVIAATNQIQMIDPALRRRFDLTLELDIPNEESVHALINHILSGTNFTFDNRDRVRSIEKKCVELSLSYYIIQKTLITAIKRSVLNMGQDILPKDIQIETSVWERLVEQEKQG